MVVCIARDAVSYTRRVPLTGKESRWYLTTDGPAHFPEWSRPSAQATTWSAPRRRPPVLESALLPDPWPLTAPDLQLWELRTSLAPWSDATGRLPLPAGIAHGYEDFVAPLHDRDGAVVGSPRGDTSLLISQAFAAEWEARQSWKPVDHDRIAHRLAEMGARCVADGFARAFDEFRCCAAITRTP